MKAEHTIQSEIMLALSRRGCIIARTNVGKVRTADGRWFDAGPKPGWPDLTGTRLKDGRAIFIEVKNERGRLRPAQKRFAERVKDTPVLYGVCRSVEDALKLIEEE